MVRPPNSPRHPDLEKAWAVYNAAVDDEAAKIRTLIAGKFDAAANKGDLEQAETWQAAADLFESSGVLPWHKETQPAVSAAQKRLSEAKTALTGAYGDAMKSLTKEKRIADAQEVRAELKALGTAAGVESPHPPSGGDAKPVNQVVIEAKDYARSIPADKGLRVAAEWEGLTIPAKAELIWEIDVAAAGEKYLHVLYASEQLRPCAISLNGKRVSSEALAKITGGFMTKDLRWETLGPFSFRRGRNLLSIKPDVVGPHLSRMVISTSKEAPVSEVP